MNLPVPCIICGRTLEPAVKDDGGYNQPYAGTAFSSYGHYGSTVFDPMPMHGGLDERLEINICDPCMAIKARDGLILHAQPQYVRPKPPTYTPWRLDDTQTKED